MTVSLGGDGGLKMSDPVDDFLVGARDLVDFCEVRSRSPLTTLDSEF